MEEMTETPRRTQTIKTYCFSRSRSRKTLNSPLENPKLVKRQREEKEKG